jgi:hypothetical protein
MSDRMDDLAKAMASGESRRGVLGKLLAGIFGAGAVLLAPRRAAAAPSDIAVCIQNFCDGLSGMTRARCVLLCVFCQESNCTLF